MTNSSFSPFTQQVVERIVEVTGPGPVSLHKPVFGEAELRNVTECLKSTFISSVSPFVNEFEERLAIYTGARHVVLTVNGTSALHLALLVAGVIPGDEVLIPTLTFVATANAVTYARATPHFVDAESTTFGIDPEKLAEHLRKKCQLKNGECVNTETGKTVRAMVVMHAFGHPSRMDSLSAVAEEFGLKLIEDAAESIGSLFKERHTGTFGHCGVISFNGNKTITTGGGGALLTDDPKLAAAARHLSTTAKVKHPWLYVHDEIGYNYRMPGINAAVGLGQLETLDSKLTAKRNLFHKYMSAFKNFNGAEVFEEPKNCRSNYWLQTLVLSEENQQYRDEILQATNKQGISTRPIWNLIHQLEPFKSSPRMDLSYAEKLSKRLINLPSSPDVGVFDES
jgi:perosamine synthetase